ncbi:hypothetical protein JCM33374_g7 [Metschnikowia sp. JCM 33374]|nr:hypothetical protein JCM33374_g7 [Metschnikowia sp. JCM 33374]
MNKSAILDLGGSSAASSTISTSHLGSGSPCLSADAYHPKRPKHYNEESKHKVAQLRARLHEDISQLLKTRSVTRSYALIYADVEHLCIAKHSEQAQLAEVIFREIDATLLSDIVPRVAQCFVEASKDAPEATARAFLDIYGNWDRLLKLLSQLFLYLDRSGAASGQNAQRPLELGGSGRFSGPNYDFGCLGRRKPAQCEHFVGKHLYQRVHVHPKGMAQGKKMYVCVLLQNMNEDASVLLQASKGTAFVKALTSKLKWRFLLADLNLYLEPALPVLTLRQNLNYLQAVKSFCDTSMADYGVDSTKILLTMWGRYVQAKTRTAVLDSDVIPSILNLWEDLLLVCKDGFKDDTFQFEVRSALTKALSNKDLSSSVVLHLSKFCDGAMKHANKTGEIDSDLQSNVLTIFKLIPEKSVFISMYEKDLSKRILMAKNFNYAFEKQLVDAIVSVVGENDENFKLRAMLRDYSKSKSFYTHVSLPCALQMDFSALVLEKKVWPEIPGFGSDIRLPPPLLSTLNEFERYFSDMDDKKHKVLDWKNYTLHQIALTTTFACETKELHVNLSQAIVLMLFETVDTMTFTDIVDATQMTEKLLRRVITSLSTDRYPILKVEGDQITLNDNFSDKAHKIKLPMGKEKDTAVLEGVKKLVQQSRSSEARAALVRIMKSHKSLLFTELLGKAIEALTPRGTPQIQDLKAEIEYLIQTDYIARDAAGTTLSYIP